MVSFSGMLRDLTEAQVRFVVIGGVAGVIHGSPRITNDLAVCYDQGDDNVLRLATLLRGWAAYPRGWPEGLPFVLDNRTFRTTPTMTFRTSLGDFDVLHRVEPIGDYHAVLAASLPVTAFGMVVPTLDLPWLIQAKRHAGRKKDHEALHELESLLARRL